MARPRIAEVQELIEKLSSRNEDGSLPSRIEEVASHQEKIDLQQGGHLSSEYRADAMRLLLDRFDASLKQIEDENIKTNAIKLANLVKNEFANFAVQDFLKDVDRDDGDFIGDGIIIAVLAFKDAQNSFNFVDFASAIQRDGGIEPNKILEYVDYLKKTEEGMKNNNQNVR